MGREDTQEIPQFTTNWRLYNLFICGTQENMLLYMYNSTKNFINQNVCRISEVRIGTEEMFSEVGSESRIHPSPARAFSEGWVLGLHRLHVCVCVCVYVTCLYVGVCLC